MSDTYKFTPVEVIPGVHRTKSVYKNTLESFIDSEYESVEVQGGPERIRTVEKGFRRQVKDNSYPVAVHAIQGKIYLVKK